MKSIAQDRLIYLAERFDVFEDDSDSVVMVKLQSLKDEGFETHLIEGGRKSKILAIVSSKETDDVKTLKKVSGVSTDFCISSKTSLLICSFDKVIFIDLRTLYKFYYCKVATLEKFIHLFH
jgi:hypothetical protein